MAALKDARVWKRNASLVEWLSCGGEETGGGFYIIGLNRTFTNCRAHFTELSELVHCETLVSIAYEISSLSLLGAVSGRHSINNVRKY